MRLLLRLEFWYSWWCLNFIWTIFIQLLWIYSRIWIIGRIRQQKVNRWLVRWIWLNSKSKIKYLWDLFHCFDLKIGGISLQNNDVSLVSTSVDVHSWSLDLIIIKCNIDAGPSRDIDFLKKNKEISLSLQESKSGILKKFFLSFYWHFLEFGL